MNQSFSSTSESSGDNSTKGKKPSPNAKKVRMQGDFGTDSESNFDAEQKNDKMTKLRGMKAKRKFAKINEANKSQERPNYVQENIRRDIGKLSLQTQKRIKIMHDRQRHEEKFKWKEEDEKKFQVLQVLNLLEKTKIKSRDLKKRKGSGNDY